MQISPITVKNQPNISYRGISEYRQGVAPYNYYNTSRFCREDFNLADYMYFLNTEYKDVPSVNIICHACSDGEETLSLKFKLLSTLGAEKSKKFHVEGRDFDAANILYARKGAYEVSKIELAKMEQEFGLDLYKYIDIVQEIGNYIYIKAKDYIKDSIPYKRVDILKDDNIPSENVGLHTRNMWPYLPPSWQVKLAQKLSKTLAPSSHIVLGQFDISNNVHHLLQEVGFEHTDIFQIMRKIPERPKVDELLEAKEILNRIKVIQQKVIEKPKITHILIR